MKGNGFYCKIESTKSTVFARKYMNIWNDFFEYFIDLAQQFQQRLYLAWQNMYDYTLSQRLIYNYNTTYKLFLPGHLAHITVWFEKHRAYPFLSQSFHTYSFTCIEHSLSLTFQYMSFLEVHFLLVPYFKINSTEYVIVRFSTFVIKSSIASSLNFNNVHTLSQVKSVSKLLELHQILSVKIKTVFQYRTLHPAIVS